MQELEIIVEKNPSPRKQADPAKAGYLELFNKIRECYDITSFMEPVGYGGGNASRDAVFFEETSKFYEITLYHDGHRDLQESVKSSNISADSVNIRKIIEQIEQNKETSDKNYTSIDISPYNTALSCIHTSYNKGPDGKHLVKFRINKETGNITEIRYQKDDKSKWQSKEAFGYTSIEFDNVLDCKISEMKRQIELQAKRKKDEEKKIESQRDDMLF